MKTIIQHALIFNVVVLLFFAQIAKAQGTEIKIPALPSTYIKQDASKFKINGSILAPKDATWVTFMNMNSSAAKGDEENGAAVKISRGMEVNIVNSKKSFADAKKELEKGKGFDKFQKYLFQDANSAFYKAKSFMGSKEMYSFIVVVEKGGKFIHLTLGGMSRDELTMDEVLQLYAVAKSFAFNK